MSDKKILFLKAIYNNKHLHAQNKAVITNLTLNSKDTGEVLIDYKLIAETIPLRDTTYLKECLSILYKYNWLIKKDNITFINYDKLKE